MKLPIFHQDKANHFIYGFFIFILSQLFFNDEVSLLIVIGFAIGKEIKDKYDYKCFDIVDMIYTILPALIIYFVR
jgi:hypothetical protein